MIASGCPASIRTQLNAAINQQLRDPAIEKRLADAGHETHPMSIADFADLIEREHRRWDGLIRSRRLSLPVD